MAITKNAVLIIGSFLLIIASCNSNKNTLNNTDHSATWQQVDSLNKLGQFSSSRELVDRIRSASEQEGNWQEEFKAWMHSSQQGVQTGSEMPDLIAAMEARTRTAPFPLKQLLHSVIATSIWNQYGQNRWVILDRTNTAGVPDDMRTWGQQRFIDATNKHHDASLTEREKLLEMPASALGDLLIEGDSLVRPSAYDILAHRALVFYSSSESRLAEPAWRYRINSEQDFDLYENFALRKVIHRDSTSLLLNSMNLYKDLTHIHIKDDDETALIQLDLNRLAFVHSNSQHNQKDSLYLRALEIMQTRVQDHPGYADIAYEIAKRHLQASNKYDRLSKGEMYKWDKVKALQTCQQAIEKFPHSVGGKNCIVLEHQLLQSQLSVRSEAALLPNNSFPVSVTYRNLSAAHLSIHELKRDVNQEDNFYGDGVKQILNKKRVRSWSVQLENDEDMHDHVLELIVDGLPLGRYALVASDSDKFRYEKDHLVYTIFWVTELGIASRAPEGNKIEINTISRKNGAPINSVKIDQYRWKNRRIGNSYELLRSATSIGNNATILTRDGQNTWRGERYVFTRGEDIFITNLNGYNAAGTPTTTRTHFFLDRAIYRPGQDIHFKGIMIRGGHNNHKVLSNTSTTVELYDVNNQKVSFLVVNTDAFGAFSGTFKAPGGLTGSMLIKDKHGTGYFQVEEYKRPKFEVVLDPLEGEQRLGQKVMATGKATSYSGIPIDGGTVQWKVSRSARRPWWCWGFYSWGLPWGNDTEIANGIAEANTNGSFNIEFEALPDASFPKASSPFFDFKIEASVTDINGETQSGASSLTLAYQSLQVDLELADVVWKDELDVFAIDVKNMNGQHVDATVDIRVVKLKQPNTPLKTRLWESPDRFHSSQAAFKQQLPNYAYSNENDPNLWGLEKEYINETGWKVDGEPYKIRKVSAWIPGTYLIGISTKDDNGELVEVRKVFTVLEKKNSEAAVASLLSVSHIKTKVQPGERAQLLLGSSQASNHVLVEVERTSGITRREWIELKNEQRVLSFKTSEADRGGYTVHITNFSEGESHVQSIQINVPWSNKELRFEWMSFRDKLLPGSEEEWRLKIVGEKSNAVSAQLLATMYDASLDQFVMHDFNLGLWSNNHAVLGFNNTLPFGAAQTRMAGRRVERPAGANYKIPLLNTFGFNGYGGYFGDIMIAETVSASHSRPRFKLRGNQSTTTGWSDSNASMQGAFAIADADAGTDASFDLENNMRLDKSEDDGGSSTQESKPIAPPIVRSDFRETAFFFPDLLTDSDGSTVLRFKTPEALTRWKIIGLSHTKDLQLGTFTKETITQKPLMVTPNLPRFFREQDKITITSKISALETRIEGLVTLELFDPFTNKSLDDAFAHRGIEQIFVCAPGESAVVEWPLNIPYGYDAVGVRIIASSKGGPQSPIDVADGEEHVLPVLTDRILVTESMPLAVKGKGTHAFSFDKLLNSASSPTLKHKALTLEYTPNPAWYAVQALPYMMEFPHACAEQTFSRYYANALASHITKEKPAIQKIFAEWKEKGSDALLSNLEKNTELKNILLEETPWLVDAQNENSQKQRIGVLFDMERMAAEEGKAINKLIELQHSSGGWSWFPGMQPSRGISQHILAGIGHLEKLGVHKFTGTGKEHQMVQSAVRYVDSEMVKDFRDLKRQSKDWKNYRPSYFDIQYLYARSFFPQWAYSEGVKTAVNFYKERIAENWLAYGLQEQGLIAMVLHRHNDKTVPGLILKSLKERATIDPELGMYWKSFKSGYSWNAFPTETHAMLIECFNEVTQDKQAVKELRVYLLKLKQTTNWKTTKATAQACYALLLGGDDWLTPMPMPEISLGAFTLKDGMEGLTAEAGTGYIKRSWQGAEVAPEMGRVSVSTSSDRVSWGAIHWQYLEQMDKVTPHETPFSIRKEIMLKHSTDEGDVLESLKDAGTIKPGDKLTIRIEMRTDRHLDYVHLKDLRGSGLEPIQKLSGYKYQGGLGYYQSIKDAGMHFFFDRISPGTYVFEYDLRVTHEGDFSNGITTAMCMYAPEFNTHSSGERVSIKAQ